MTPSLFSHIFTDILTVLKALWSVKIVWQDLNTATKNILTDIITEERTPYTVRTFVSVFFSLTHVQATYLQIGDTNTKKSENNFQEKQEKNLTLQQNENLQKVFLVGLSKFSSALNRKQLSNVFYILRVRNILWASLSSSTRNVLLGKIQLFSEEFSSREIISILSGLVSCETLIPNSDLSKNVLTYNNGDENRTNDDESMDGYENENEEVVKSEKMETNEITVTATLKSVLSAISRICNDFTETEAKSLADNLSKIGLFYDLNDRTRNILYSKMIENSLTIRPSTTPASTLTSSSISASAFMDEYDNILMNSRTRNDNENEIENKNETRNVKHSDCKISVDEEMKKLNDLDFKKNTDKKVNNNDQNNLMQYDTREVKKSENEFIMKTNEENLVKQSEVYKEIPTTSNAARERTGSESVRAFEWVKALVRSNAIWSDLRYELM